MPRSQLKVKKKKRGIEGSQEDMSMIITFEVNAAANQLFTKSLSSLGFTSPELGKSWI